MEYQMLSPEAQHVLTIGREKWWGIRVAEGVGTLPEETYQDGWWYLPIDSTQETRASKRIELLRKSGVRIRQVIIAHEAPKLLCAPQAPTSPGTPQKSGSPIRWKIALWGVTGLLTAGGIVFAALTIAMALISLLAPLVVGVALVLMLGMGVLVDPCAIVVLEDGTRIEVMRWIE